MPPDALLCVLLHRTLSVAAVRIVRVRLDRRVVASSPSSLSASAPAPSTPSGAAATSRSSAPSTTLDPYTTSTGTVDIVFDSSGVPLQRMTGSHMACLPSVAAVEPMGGCDPPRGPYLLSGGLCDPCLSLSFNTSAGFTGGSSPPELLSLRLLNVRRTRVWGGLTG